MIDYPTESEFASWELGQWLRWLESCHPTEIELGLERIRRVADALALSRPAPKVVTVAGTNGKGSTIAYLERMLQSMGLRAGCYTSPHFLHYNERVRIGGEPVSDQELCRAFATIEHARRSLSDCPSLTYFEYGTLAALVVFDDSQLDVALLEVGLGGRLDAVNIVDPDVAVVTTVDLDHQDWLGSDRETIGREKAGIFRAGVPAVYGESRMPASVAEVAAHLGAPLFQLGVDYLQGFEAEAWHWQGRTEQGGLVELHGLPYPSLPIENAATALQVCALLGCTLDTELMGSAISAATLTGRMQRIRDAGTEVILDVAHNPHAARYLAAQLAREQGDGRTLAVLGMLADKDPQGVVAPLAERVSVWYLGGLGGSRGQEAQGLARAIAGIDVGPVSCHASISDAYAAALAEAEAGDRVLVLGSFFTIAEVLQKQLSAPSAVSSGAHGS